MLVPLSQQLIDLKTLAPHAAMPTSKTTRGQWELILWRYWVRRGPRRIIIIIMPTSKTCMHVHACMQFLKHGSHHQGGTHPWSLNPYVCSGATAIYAVQPKGPYALHFVGMPCTMQSSDPTSATRPSSNKPSPPSLSVYIMRRSTGGACLTSTWQSKVHCGHHPSVTSSCNAMQHAFRTRITMSPPPISCKTLK
jgi:hypothetical protein